MIKPSNIQLIGTELALQWPDGTEDYFQEEFLRANSPSAQNTGEPDIFGRIQGGDSRTEFPGVKISKWTNVGNYAIQIHFSDGHSTGIFSWDFFLKLREFLENNK